jgi:N-acetylmuramoyl-L-alanine amidase
MSARARGRGRGASTSGGSAPPSSAASKDDPGGGGPSRPLPPRIAAILNDYVRNQTLARALRVKVALIEGADRLGLPLLENPKRSANFAVLRAPDVPSLLIETGFLSNPQDEARLRDPAQRRRVADFLADQIARTLAGPIFI